METVKVQDVKLEQVCVITLKELEEELSKREELFRTLENQKVQVLGQIGLLRQQIERLKKEKPKDDK